MVTHTCDPDSKHTPCCIANMENVDDVRSTMDDGIMDWMNSTQ